MHVVLKEVEEVLAQPLAPTKQERLQAIGEGCYRVLNDLENLVKRFQSLATQSKRTWDRTSYSMEDIAQLRARLTSNTGLLTAWISISQFSVEKKLDEILKEIRDGHRQGSVISTQTTDSLCNKEVWHTIQKELEDIGITVTVFDANKDFIFEWFMNAVARGAFEEQLPDESLIAEGPSAYEPEVVKTTSRVQHKLEARQCDAPISQVAIFSPPITGPSNAGAMLSGEDATRNGWSVLLPQKIATGKPRIPRAVVLVAGLIAGLSRPSKSLTTAVKQNDILSVREILNDQRKLVWLDRKLFDRAMCEAAALGHEQVIRLLLEKGADIHTAGKFDDSALQCASENGHEQVVRLLLEKGADINADGGYGSALHRASKHGHGQVVRLLLETGADVNGVAVLGSSALQLASEMGHAQVVRLLLEKGANVNAARQGTKSALQWASEHGHEQIVQLLLEKGADAGGEFCRSALRYASENGHVQVVRLLLEKGTNVNTGFLDSALKCAWENGHEQVAVLLLKKGGKYQNLELRSDIYYEIRPNAYVCIRG